MNVPHPFVKWPGGKGRLLEQYEKHFPQDFKSYHEPFVGGGAVFFSFVRKGILTGKKIVLSDKCPRLIEAWTSLRDHADEVIDSLQCLISERTSATDKDLHYYKTRILFNEGKPGPYQSARFLFLNRICFNGLYRENKDGGFNSPVGNYKNPTILDEKNLRAVSSCLSDVEILCQDFRASLQRVPDRGLLYVDPPYYPVKKDSFVSFTEEKFGEDDQRDLADLCRKARDRGATVVASNSNVPAVRRLWKGFQFRTIKARRAINSNGKGRGVIQELLILGGVK